MNGQAIIGFGLLFLVVYSITKKTAYMFQDTISDTILGDLTGTRTVEASEAAKWIRNCLWLKKEYRDWLLSPTFKFLEKYRVDIMGAQNAEDVAKVLIDSNFKIFDNATLEHMANFIIQYGFHTNEPDNPGQAVGAITRIKNQAQALEVTWYYWHITGKNLSAGLQWLPDAQIIEIANYLKTLPTGVYTIPGNKQLQQLPKP